MADVVTNYAAVSDDALPVMIERRMLQLSERQMLLQGQTCEQFTLPSRMGKTMRINRYGRMAAPTTTLTEGVPPDAVSVAVTKVEATVEQWGIVGLMTDVAEQTIFHDLLSVMIDRTTRAINETKEREIATVLLGGTNIFYAGGKTSRATLLATDKISTTDIVKITASLRDNGAPDWDGLYIGIMPPQMEADIYGDPTFVTAASYSQVVRLNVAEIGTYAGVRWSRMNFLPKFKGVGAPGTQGAEISGYGTETGSGSGIGAAKIIVVARDVQSGYERKISLEKTAGATVDSAVVTTATSPSYVYDIYMTAPGGAAASYKKVFSGVPANTAKTLNAAAYAAGTTATPPSAPASGVTTYVAFIFGKEAYGDVKLSGMSLQSYLTPGGSSFSDPLAQARKMGAKYMAKPLILRNEFFARYESGSAQPDGLAA